MLDDACTSGAWIMLVKCPGLPNPKMSILPLRSMVKAHADPLRQGMVPITTGMVIFIGAGLSGMESCLIENMMMPKNETYVYE